MFNDDDVEEFSSMASFSYDDDYNDDFDSSEEDEYYDEEDDFEDDEDYDEEEWMGPTLGILPIELKGVGSIDDIDIDIDLEVEITDEMVTYRTMDGSPMNKDLAEYIWKMYGNCKGERSRDYVRNFLK